MTQHIRRTDKPIDQSYYPSWCGRRLAHHNWVFQDAEHAMLYERGRLMPWLKTPFR